MNEVHISAAAKKLGCHPHHLRMLEWQGRVVIECDAEQAAEAKAWLEKMMIEGMDAIVNGTDEGHVPVEVEARIARGWGERG